LLSWRLKHPQLFTFPILRFLPLEITWMPHSQTHCQWHLPLWIPASLVTRSLPNILPTKSSRPLRLVSSVDVYDDFIVAVAENTPSPATVMREAHKGRLPNWT